MNLSLLENKLREIREKKESLKMEIQNNRKSFNTLDNVLGSEWWYSTNYNYKVFNNGQQIHAELSENQHIYLSYKENNVNFSQSPNFPIIINENELSCEMIGTASESLKVTLYLIGYKSNQKIKFEKISLNSNQIIKFDKSEIDCYRIAVKLEGTGYFKLDKIKLGSKVIKGFLENEVYNTEVEVVNPVLNLDIDFNNIVDISLENLTVPTIFSSYVKKGKKKLKSNVPDGRYAYLQNGNGPMFEINSTETIQSISTNSHYEFGLAANTTKNLDLELVVVGYSEAHSPVEVKLIKNNSKELVKFQSETTLVKLLLRVQGVGEISNVKIGICEKLRRSTYETNLDFSESEWFNPKNSQSEIQKKGEELIISSDILDSKPNYISYKEKNNSFSKVPNESAFKVDSDHYYEILINSSLSGSGTITPIIITYSDLEKENIINLKLNEVNRIQFKESIKHCRISFKMNGTAQLSIKEFIIAQYPVLEDAGKMEWLDPKEVSLLGLVPKKELKSVKMAAIFDEFTMECFAHECQLITFTPDNWKEVLINTQPDLLMVESAWRGNNGTWIKKVQYQNEDSITELKELIQWCKQNNIPTVFWNKEDPVHYEHFIGTAKLFDFVFTTDINMVPMYKEACGHDRVAVLQFAAQPIIHNPITIGKRENAVSFAGSYYAKHVERTEDMLRIFNSTLPYGLAIFDRNYEKVKQGLLPNNRFPQHLEPNVRGSLKYYEIDKAYKGFKVMINVNTVKNSPTMFARRVYEGLACGTPIVSNYSEGIEKSFGDIVSVSETEKEIKTAISDLFENDDVYRRVTVEGIRRVLNQHTYSDRVERIIGLLQLPYKKCKRNIVVIGKAETVEAVQVLVDKFNRQTYEYKRLIVIYPDEVLPSISSYESDIIQILSLYKFSQTYSNLIEIEKCDYISIINEMYDYPDNHLLDLSLAVKYAPWEIITINNCEELKFEQIDDADMYLSIVKPSLFSIMSSIDAINFLTNEKDIPYLKARGARILGISTY
jgi:spore maturation protein CgeB